MLIGLGRLSALASSLLLNLEAPFTALLAVWIFREHLGARALGSLGLVVSGAALLAWRPGALEPDVLGVLAIAGACLCWALDNNLTQRLSARDPVALARIKTLGAGGCSLLLALATGQRFSSDPAVLLGALVLGAFAYGLSIVLATHALRLLGAAREAALFATGPFVGALLSIPLLGDRPRLTDAASGLLMAAGVALLLTERHVHVHTHEALEHDHAHVHDEHHQHEHEGPVVEPHAHLHRHEPVTHEHPHLPDAHHRHGHKGDG
jgi:drug/metabolite transporter (DMT)-like permease